MIYYFPNIFKLNAYKCDYYGNKKTLPREIICKNFKLSIQNENNAGDLLFGESVIPNQFYINNQTITINFEMIVSLNLCGYVDPGFDLILNSALYSFQGTTTPIKVKLTNYNGTSAVFEDSLVAEGLNLESEYSDFIFFLVNNNEYRMLNATGYSNSNNTLTYSNSDVLTDAWIEIFKYKNFPIHQEPMLLLETTEGILYPCLVNKLQFSLSGDYAIASVEMVCLNFNTSIKYDLLRGTEYKTSGLTLKPVFKYQISVSNQSDINNTFDYGVDTSYTYNFLNQYNTQNLSEQIVKNFSFSLTNQHVFIYGNASENYSRMKPIAIVATGKNISGGFEIISRKSIYPSGFQLPLLLSSRKSDLLLGIENLYFIFKNVIFTPGNISYTNNDFVMNELQWNSLSTNKVETGILIMEGQDE